MRLEYLPEVVMVHDILIERKDSRCTQTVSAYPKVRVSVGVVKEMLRENNTTLLHQEVRRGMTYLVSRKSS